MSRPQRLLVVLLLNCALVAGLLVVGVTAHSLAVMAAGGDYLLDAAGVGVALVGLRLSTKPASHSRPGGYPNASNIAALANGGWLLILELLVAGAAVDRLATGTPEVHGLPVLIISAIAAVVMAAGAFILHRDDGDEDDDLDPSVAAVLLDTIADAAAAAGVAVTGAIILATGGWYWLDPAAALIVALVIAYHALALIRKVFPRLRTPSPDSTG